MGVGVSSRTPPSQLFHCCFKSQKTSEELLKVEPVVVPHPRLDQERTEVTLIHALLRQPEDVHVNIHTNVLKMHMS